MLRACALEVCVCAMHPPLRLFCGVLLMTVACLSIYPYATSRLHHFTFPLQNSPLNGHNGALNHAAARWPAAT